MTGVLRILVLWGSGEIGGGGSDTEVQRDGVGCFFFFEEQKRLKL